MGELKQGSDSDSRTIVLVGGETFKAESETADLQQPKWNENQTVLATAIHTLDRDVKLGDCGVIPWRGLLLTVERHTEGM